MKRSCLIAFATLMISLTTATSARACCLPWLDPFAWLGFYGCGYNAYGYGYPGYGYPGYAYPTYGYRPAYQPVYRPYTPPVMYSPTTGSDCGCTSLPQPTFSSSQYSNGQFGVARYQPTPTYSQPMTSAAFYNSATVSPLPVYGGTVTNMAPTTYYPSPVQTSPNVATPLPAGDINGDHEYPSQSAVTPAMMMQQRLPAVPIQRVSYGFPRSATRTYSASVR